MPRALVAGVPAQAAEAREPHDCTGDKPKTESDCRTAFFQSLPPPTGEFVYSLSLQWILASHHLSPSAFDLLPGRRIIHLSAAGPPIASFKPNLRI